MNKLTLKNPLVVQALIFTVSVIVMILILNIGLGKTITLRDQLVQARTSVATLSEKEALLSEVNEDILGAVTVASSALPPTNSSLSAVSQIKSTASESFLSVANIKVGSEIKEKGDISRVDVSFDADGDVFAIFDFISKLNLKAPILLIDKIRISGSGGTSRATINLRAYWASYPTKLSGVTDKINDLTPDERRTFEGVSSLIQPPFLEVLPVSPTQRTDPFN